MSSFSPSKFTSGSRSDRIALAISKEGTAAADERVMEEEEEEEEEDKNASNHRFTTTEESDANREGSPRAGKL